MIIKLLQSAQTQAIEQLMAELRGFGHAPKILSLVEKNFILLPPKTNISIDQLDNKDIIGGILVSNQPYQLVTKDWQAFIGNPPPNLNSHSPLLILGPCSIESEDQLVTVAQFLRQNNVRWLRAGAFKPRTSPYSFQGLGLEGLKLAAQVAKDFELFIVSEILEASQIEQMAPYVDVFQVGARSSQNYLLLSELGKIDKPVILKRSLSGTLDELLLAAEYILSGGNSQLILCERGIRTFETAYRNTLDLNAIPLLKMKTHLPVIVDPSHGTGNRLLVEPMALASIAAGADGLMVEIHPNPEMALSDGAQSLSLPETHTLITKVHNLATFLEQ